MFILEVVDGTDVHIWMSRYIGHALEKATTHTLLGKANFGSCPFKLLDGG